MNLKYVLGLGSIVLSLNSCGSESVSHTSQFSVNSALSQKKSEILASTHDVSLWRAKNREFVKMVDSYSDFNVEPFRQWASSCVATLKLATGVQYENIMGDSFSKPQLDTIGLKASCSIVV